MFYIYHIPEINKIGCTNNITKRIENQQGYKKYNILFKTNCINEASEKEIEYQKKYNYKLDLKPYKTIIMNSKLYKTEHTTTFVGTKSDQLKNFNFPNFIEINKEKIPLNEFTLNWIKNNNYKSQFSEERFIYNQSLYNYYVANKKENIFDNIRAWANERNIISAGDKKTQYIKLIEEIGELSESILKNDKKEFIDAIGDCVVVLTNLAAIEKLKIEDCIDSAYKEITDRKGKIINGTFVKEK